MERAFALALTAWMTLAAVARSQELVRIGAAAAVTGKVLAIDPLEQQKGAPAGRILSSGKTVYHLDKIVSGKEGRLQVMLLDQTVFTLGPNTEMTLDEFVYDPFTDSGKITANVTKGVFRFVTGKVARKDPENMKIKMPVGTMGIRGTIGGGWTNGQQAVAAFYGPGANNDTGDKPAGVYLQSIPTIPGAPPAQTDLNQPNTGSLISGLGATPTQPFDLKELGKIIASVKAEEGVKQDEGGADSEPSLDTTPEPSEGSEGGGSTPPGGDTGGSVTEDAGAGTADSLASLEDTGSIGEVATDADQTVTQLSQTAGGILDGIAQWDQLNNNLSGGTGYFSGNGTYTCSGGVCDGQFLVAAPVGGGGSGNLSYTMGICFLTKTYGGGSISFTDGPLVETWTDITSGQAFPMSGDGVLTLGSGTSHSNSAFDGTTLTIINSGGVQATGLGLNLQYGGSGGETATGSGTATFIQGQLPPG
ncbi:MAG: FecR domain-containing protein [Elusimicrobiota bacterium]